MAVMGEVQLKSAMAKLPCEWGSGVVASLGAVQANLAGEINTFAGLTIAAEESTDVCPKYDTFKYSEKKYCRLEGLRYYRTYFRDASIGWLLDWNLESPDGTIWTPSVDTTGSVLTFTPGSGVATAVPVLLLLGAEDTMYQPSISNDGVLSLAPTAWDTERYGAAIFDSEGTTWVLWADADGNHVIGLDVQATQVRPMRYISMDIKFVAGQGGRASATNDFLLARLAANVEPTRDSEGAYQAFFDFVHHKSISLDIEFSNGDFLISHMEARVKRLKKIPRG